MSAVLEEASRLCPVCKRAEPIQEREPVWPNGWRCATCGFAVTSRDGIPLYAPELADIAVGMDPASFQSLAAFELSHFWFVARRNLIIGLINKYFGVARSILEIGCGNGAVLLGISQSKRWARLVGSELHPAGLTIARERLGPVVELVQMDATRIPAANAFDVVGAFDVLEHVGDDVAVLNEIRRVLRPGGGVIITVPQHPWLWSYADEVALHQRRYKRNELERKLRSSGFEVVFSTSYATILFPLIAINRIVSSMIGQNNQKGVDREYHISRLANEILRRITEAEIRLTLKGVRWPCGGSRVVIARRV